MFQAKARAEVLKEVVNVVSTLVDEAKFTVNSDGLTIKAVDPAHIAMVDLTLGKDAFGSTTTLLSTDRAADRSRARALWLRARIVF